jgi:acyl-CoA synthetase (AMP-forming)/AMP-acid ligase II
LPAQWVDSTRLITAINQWHGWLTDKPDGAWLLCERDPLLFCSALIALWETGRIATLPADDRPETLAHIVDHVAGQLPHKVDVPTAVLPINLPSTLNPESQALVLFTSGSSGEPVQLSKTFRQLDAELRVHAQLWPLSATSGVASQVSHQHIYGLLAGILHPLCSGAPFASHDCHFPEVLAERLSEAQARQLIVTLVSSPPQLSRLPDHVQWQELASISRVFSSGAPLAPGHALTAESLLGAPVIEIYGSTETGGIAWRRQQQGDLWTPLPGVEVATDDHCLTLTSPFLPNPHVQWRHPDRIELGTEGFKLLGREDRLVKVAGKRLSLDRMESVLEAVEGVETARCVDLGRSDGRLGAIVVMTSAFLPSEHKPRANLVRQLRSQLDAHFETVTLPRYWRFVAQLPSNPQGKLDRSIIRRLFNDIADHKSPRWLGESCVGADVRDMSLEVPEKLIFLDGHFDRFSLVPGVVMVQWAVHLGQLAFGNDGLFCGIEQLKFQRPLRPGMRFILQLTRRPDGIAFVYESHEGRHAAGRIKLTANTESDA